MNEKRFELLFAQGRLTPTTEIWVDKETGVQYLFHREGAAAGLTPLLGQDGKPIVRPTSERASSL